METMVAKKPPADLLISLPRCGYEYRFGHRARLPGAKIGMSSGSTWGNRVLHLCLRYCPSHRLPEQGIVDLQGRTLVVGTSGTRLTRPQNTGKGTEQLSSAL